MAEPASESLADLLRRHRAAAALTQEELAERAGLSARAISDLERGIKRRPHPYTVQQLIQALGLGDEEAAHLRRAARGAGSDRHGPGAPGEVGGPGAFLPIPPTPFIGRRQEMTEVSALLRREEVRLLNLTGAGGIGKTRLALEVARQALEAFPDGVFFVWLAPLADPALVPVTVAGALGIDEMGGQPVLETLRERLRARSVLLILDNFEHLLTAGTTLSYLLATCPRLKLLVTSRASLQLAAEHEYLVPPLAVPASEHRPALGTEALSRCDAVQLFVQRAQAIQAGFQLTGENGPAVAEICRRLDGLPLAIELAAARIRLFAPGALLARLADPLRLLVGGARDLPARQRTLRDTIDWSYGLLAPAEQALLARLAVFAGGATLEAIEAVCGEGNGQARDGLGQLDSLVRASLLRIEEDGTGSGRFQMLRTIREYAWERLAARGEAAALRQRHAAYFAELAEQAEPAMWGGPEQHAWLRRLELEHDNLRAALASAEEAGEAHLHLRLAASLGRFWFIHGHATEGRRRLERALAAGPEADASLRARVLVALGMLARQQADPVSAVAYFEESLSLFRALGDERWLAFTLFGLGNVWQVWGDWRRGAELLEASLALSQGRGGHWGFVRGLPLVMLGWLLLEQGEQARALPLLQEALALGTRLGDQVASGTALIGLGWAAHFAGDDRRALALLEEALGLFRALGHHQGRLDALASLGWVSLQGEDDERAAALFREALTLADESGYRAYAGDCLRGLGGLAGLRGEARLAAELFGAAEGLRERAGTPPYPSGAAYRRAAAAVRAELGDAAWEEATAAGRSRPIPETIAAALAAATPASGGR
ncbi:MAG TPA: tetratricopeptide repeat protein [Nitrolancea sp.]|nr:tetratricopeptide repeat protein [Nitrolancea sp.]